jgi:hypothetical protein
MLNKLFYTLSIVFLLSVSPEAYAGFWVKKAVVISQPVAAATVAEPGELTSVQTVNTALPTDKYRGDNSFRSFTERGWVSVASVICGLLGFLYPGFAFAAILFGFIGLASRKKKRHPLDRKKSQVGLAALGLILGLVVAGMVIFGGFTGVF